MEGARSEAGGVVVELGTDSGPLSGKVDVVDHHPVVQPGAGDEQRTSTAPGDVVQRIACGIPELGDRELDARIDEVDEVVTDFGLLGGRRLGGPDVHPAVDLHRVDGDDLDADTAPDIVPGGRHRHHRLARRRGADHRDARWARARRHSAATGIRSL